MVNSKDSEDIQENNLQHLRAVLIRRAIGERGRKHARQLAQGPPRCVPRVPAVIQRRVDFQISVIERLGIVWVPPWRWPARLIAVQGAACGFFVRGSPHVLKHRAISIVGARRSSASAEHWAWERADEAVRAGYTVISGGARGIDGAAHRGALTAKGCTAAFVGVGCDSLYPACHRRLFGQMIERGGAVLSEHPPGEGGRSFDHASRNRFIAALAEHVWVAEAGLRSGTLTTARHGLALGRPVFVSPDGVGSIRSGLETLLNEGALQAATLRQAQSP